MISPCHEPPNVILSASNAYIRTSDHFKRSSKMYNKRSDTALPKLLYSELTVGSLVGRGAYSSVYEITSISLQKNFKHTKPQVKSRESIKNCVKEEDSGNCRYVIKLHREDLVKHPKLLEKGSVNLAVEAKILSSIKHPNIIRLRGICCPQETAFITGEGAGIILDRINETLDQRIVKWRIKEKNLKSMVNRTFCQKKKKSFSILSTKLNAAVGISGALKYLHSKSIIFRDLKPENLGFDSFGQIKLFDFGLARELHPKQNSGNETFSSIGRAGSLRYMAPEVYKREPYNFAADVYSFSLVLWEILTCERVFENYDIEKLEKDVIQCNIRPLIESEWPTSIQNILKQGWSQYLIERPSFVTIDKALSSKIFMSSSVLQ